MEPTLFLALYGTTVVDSSRLQSFYRVIDATEDVPATAILASGPDKLTAYTDGLIDSINRFTGPFTMAGASYGALTMSRVWAELQSGGRLAHRRHDFLGAVTNGNPAREEGKFAPGIPDPGGHGILGQADRMVDTPDTWWDFATAGDVISVNGDDTVGHLATAIWDFLYWDFDGLSSEVVAAAQAANDTAPLELVAELALGILSSITWSIPHMTYFLAKPIDGDPRTTPQIATDHLISLVSDTERPTVLTMAGFLGSPQNLNLMLRESITRGNLVVPVYYNNWIPNDLGVADGMNKLDVALHTYPGKKVVFAHSFGAVACCRWLAQKGPTSDIDPADVQFILLGNSTRRYGGLLNDTHSLINFGTDLIGYSRTLAPVGTPYRVLDVSRQYDGFSDVPSDAALADADQFANWTAGQQIVHPDYRDVDINGRGNAKFVEGNITYITVPTYPLPMLDSTKWATTYTLERDTKLRPIIEQGFDRPAPFPEPVATPAIGGPRSALGLIGSDGPPNSIHDPISSYRYLDARRTAITEYARTCRPLIRLWDHNMNYMATIASELSVSAEEQMHDSGQATIEVYGQDWVVDLVRHDVRRDQDLHITIDPYPNNRNWRRRWGGKVVNIKVKRDENAIVKVVFECLHNREHWKHILIAATPFTPPEFQPLRAWLMPSNCRTAVFASGFLNLARNYMPVLTQITNAANPGMWLGEGVNFGNLSPLNWPVQMQFVNPVNDQSRFTVLMSRWSDAHSICDGVLKDAGCHVRAYTWLPEDEDSPHPELAELIGEDAARPNRACVVLAVEDKSGVTGPTGTALDGVINLVAATADNLITEVLYEVVDNEVIDPRTNSPVPPIIREMFGVAPKLPDITFRDTKHSAIISSEHNSFRTKAQTITTGGKSPALVNQAQTFGIRYGLSFVAYVVPHGPEGGGQPPGTEGLDNIYQGQADDVLLPYLKFTDPVRALRAGPYAFLEHGEQNSTGYTASGALASRQGHWKTRAYQSFKVSVMNALPHTVFIDYDLGDRVMFEIDSILYTDQVQAIKLHYDRDTPKTYDITIGDDAETESPVAASLKAGQRIWAGVGVLFGSQDLI